MSEQKEYPVSSKPGTAKEAFEAFFVERTISPFSLSEDELIDLCGKACSSAKTSQERIESSLGGVQNLEGFKKSMLVAETCLFTIRFLRIKPQLEGRISLTRGQTVEEVGEYVGKKLYSIRELGKEEVESEVFDELGKELERSCQVNSRLGKRFMSGVLIGELEEWLENKRHQ